MELIQKTDGTVDSEWFTKPTDTGTVMNWNSIAPMKYKRNLVSGFVNRIWSATTTYDAFMSGCEKAKVILSKNQFPQSWINFNFHRVIENVHHRRSHPRDTLDKNGKKLTFQQENDTESRMKTVIFFTIPRYRNRKTCGIPTRHWVLNKTSVYPKKTGDADAIS